MRHAYLLPRSSFELPYLGLQGLSGIDQALKATGAKELVRGNFEDDPAVEAVSAQVGKELPPWTSG
jgi:hypothetical protein